jgi:membrane protease YdiL (CAAX protease family)
MSRFFFICTTAFALFAFFVSYFIKGALNFNHSLSTWIDVILLVGITEELVFRGFIQQELEEIFQNFWVAAIISSVLFAVMHVPYAKLVGFTLRDYFYIALGGACFLNNL